MNLTETYIAGLKNAYGRYKDGVEQWNQFEGVKEGATDEDIDALVARFPDVPKELIELLKYADGTYFREYQGEEICLYFLGSDVEEYGYPYYLLSSKQMTESTEATDYYADYVDRAYEEDEVYMDERIIDDSEKMNWLHFSDCMNNGGSSQLFIDYSPSDKGTKGQIVRFLLDPDEIVVIADSFAEYLQMLIEHNYAFINQDTI